MNCVVELPLLSVSFDGKRFIAVCGHCGHWASLDYRKAEPLWWRGMKHRCNMTRALDGTMTLVVWGVKKLAERTPLGMCACGVSNMAPQYMHRHYGNHSCKFHVGLRCKVCVMINDIYKYLERYAAFNKYLKENEAE